MTDYSKKIQEVRKFLLILQDNICRALEEQELKGGIDGSSEEKFTADIWERNEGGGGRSCVMLGGRVIEKAGVMFSHIHINQMPAAATQRYPELVGKKADRKSVV